MLTDQIANRYGLDPYRLPVRGYMLPDRGTPWYDLGPARFSTDSDGELICERPVCEHCFADADAPKVIDVAAPLTRYGLIDEYDTCPNCYRPISAGAALSVLVNEYRAARVDPFDGLAALVNDARDWYTTHPVVAS